MPSYAVDFGRSQPETTRFSGCTPEDQDELPDDEPDDDPDEEPEDELELLELEPDDELEDVPERGWMIAPIPFARAVPI